MLDFIECHDERGDRLPDAAISRGYGLITAQKV